MFLVNCLSTNWGQGITNIYPQAVEAWTAVACCANGTKMMAGAYAYGIWASIDAGATWTPTGPPWLQCSSVAMSADGMKVVATGGPNLSFPSVVGGIYTSADSGSTWVSNSAPVTNWSCVSSSADGCKLVAAVNGGGIYTWQATPAPALSISPSGTNVVLSWIVPSMNFVLQESSDLGSGHWTDVATTPVLNYTNLNQQVSLPWDTGNRFYRLVSR